MFETLVEEKRVGLEKIAQRVMTSKTPAHRPLHMLVELGYAEQDPDTEKCSLTLKLFSLVARSLRSMLGLRKRCIQPRLARRCWPGATTRKSQIGWQ